MTTDKNFIEITLTLPYLASAAQARAAGFTVPENIPDCAIYKPPGVFEWVKAEITIKGKPS